MPTLGQSLSRAISQLTDVIDSLPDGAQRDDLITKQKAMAAELEALIDGNVRADTVLYAKATAALQKANDSLAAAHADIQKVAATITAVAQAVETVAAVAASVK